MPFEYDVEPVAQEQPAEAASQHASIATGLLLGLVSPSYRLPQFLAVPLAEAIPALDSWRYASGLWEVVSDLAPSVDRFLAQALALRENQTGFPCHIVSRGDLIPIDPVVLPGFELASLGPQFSNEQRYWTLDTEPLNVHYFPVEEAFLHFSARLFGFVSTRIAGTPNLADDPGATPAQSGNVYTFPKGAPPGLLFRVTTLTSGLQVHFTHQFYLNPNYVFGAPSTPVDGLMPPGRWHFGTSSRGGPVAFDTSCVFDVPSVSRAHLNV